MIFSRRFILAGRVLLVTLVPSVTLAQEPFGVKPIRVISSYAHGSVVVILARPLGEKIGSANGSPFVVESKPGGGGNIGTYYVARAPADGQTGFIATASNA